MNCSGAHFLLALTWSSSLGLQSLLWAQCPDGTRRAVPLPELGVAERRQPLDESALASIAWRQKIQSLYAGTAANEVALPHADYWNWKAWQDVGLLERQGSAAVVRACEESGSRCVLLLLHRPLDTWTLLDAVRLDDFRYAFPEVQVIASPGRRWIVVEANRGGGTGVSQRMADWYEAQCGRLVKVLSTPATGWDVNAEPARDFAVRFGRLVQEADRETLEFAAFVRFEDYANEQPLWEAEFRIVQSRSGFEKPFRFDTARSQLSEEDAAALFSYESLTTSAAMRLFFPQMLRIARAGSGPQREWLRRFLPSMPDGRQRAQLEKALQR